MKEIISYLNEMREKGLIEDYTIGGATALIYYYEPFQTYDIDVFVILSSKENSLVNLSPLYDFLKTKNVKIEKEYVIINNTPVQFLVPYNKLVEEAVKTASYLPYDHEEVKIPKLEYLMAIMVQTSRPKDKARLAELINNKNLFDESLFYDILNKHNLLDKYKAAKKWIES